MTEEMSGDNALTAFGEILSEFDEARAGLVEALARAAESGDYGSVAELTERLKRADTLKNEVERLGEEWQAVFLSDDTETEPLEPPADSRTAFGVPDQYDLCSPTLQALRALGGRGRIRDIVETVIDQMGITGEVTRKLHEGGPQTELEWQLGWARTILKTCGLVDNPQPGLWVLTEAGSRQQRMEAGEVKVLYRQHLDLRRQREQGGSNNLMPQQRWTREQDLAVLYIKIEFARQLTPTHPEIERLAKAMNRTEASIWMRKGNFDSLDPLVQGRGLDHPAKLTVDIWAEYERDPERVLAEAHRAYLSLVG